MKKTIISSAAVAIAVGLSGCAQVPSSGGSASSKKAAASKSPEQVAYESTLAAAKTDKKAAAASGGEWRDIGKFLKGADKAAKAGDFKKAQKLAAKAKFQADTGKAQAAAESGVGNPSYLY